MPNVKQCDVVEKRFRGAVTEWNVEVDNMPFTWRQQDDFDIPNFLIKFKLISGDLERFQGSWILCESEGGGTEVTVEASVKLGIPILEEVIGGQIAEKLRKNFDLMLEAINERLTLRRYKNIKNRAISDIKGFAVIGHPYNMQHLVRIIKYYNPDFIGPSRDFLLKIFDMAPSYSSSQIKGFKSKTGKEVDGIFVMCPMIPASLVLDADKVLKKVIQACKIAEEHGVGIVTLGGFTSIAGERFSQTLLDAVHVPITTGNTFTSAMVIAGVEKAAGLMGVNLEHAKVTIIGGNGDIGGACARVLCRQVKELTITGRNPRNLMIKGRILADMGTARISTSLDNNEAVKDADIVIAAASSTSTIVDFKCFKPGVIVCDVGYPKNISYTDCDRDDILIFSGGICSIPSEFSLGFDLGLPQKNVLYGCFAEAILLDLEERYENFSWGKGSITPDRIRYIREVGLKHGFDVAPFFWGNRIVPDEEVEKIAKLKTG